MQITAVKNICNNSYKIFGNSKRRQLTVQIESPLPYGIKELSVKFSCLGMQFQFKGNKRFKHFRNRVDMCSFVERTINDLNSTTVSYLLKRRMT